ILPGMLPPRLKTFKFSAYSSEKPLFIRNSLPKTLIRLEQLNRSELYPIYKDILPRPLSEITLVNIQVIKGSSVSIEEEDDEEKKETVTVSEVDQEDWKTEVDHTSVGKGKRGKQEEEEEEEEKKSSKKQKSKEYNLLDSLNTVIKNNTKYTREQANQLIGKWFFHFESKTYLSLRIDSNGHMLRRTLVSVKNVSIHPLQGQLLPENVNEVYFIAGVLWIKGKRGELPVTPENLACISNDTSMGIY